MPRATWQLVQQLACLRCYTLAAVIRIVELRLMHARAPESVHVLLYAHELQVNQCQCCPACLPCMAAGNRKYPPPLALPSCTTDSRRCLPPRLLLILDPCSAKPAEGSAAVGPALFGPHPAGVTPGGLTGGASAVLCNAMRLCLTACCASEPTIWPPPSVLLGILAEYRALALPVAGLPISLPFSDFCCVMYSWFKARRGTPAYGAGATPAGG
jgi:hypothetical protein